ncbi:hypothetical protein LJR090_000807 [Bosea sp. LjRoot90]|uniref:hypothetical protein n=1 Tax=Bosea sp. LjRoot90 TaxID=3342342 RepID=UPI003ECCAC42
MATISLTSRTTLLALCLCAAPLASASASEGGGGGGGGDDRWAVLHNQPQLGQQPAASYAHPGRVGRAGNARPGGGGGAMQHQVGVASAETVLPDGTRVRSIGLASGDRFVTTVTPDGVVRTGFRPAGQRADQAGARSRTTYNSQTGITSTWTTQADGTRVGVHVDRQGNRAVSTSR